MTERELAEQLAEAMLAPVRDVGVFLARELEKLSAEVAELRQHVAGLQERVRELER